MSDVDDAVNLLVYHIGSGHAFFSGTALVLAGVAASLGQPGPWRRSLRNLAVALGVILVMVSATPLPAWLYALLGAGTLAWIVVESGLAPARRQAARVGVAGLWLTAGAWELPYHLTPTLPWNSAQALTVIGDSVSAGMGEDRSTTWPALLAQQHGIVVHDRAQMGTTVVSARKQAAAMPAGAGLVLLAIGGNDLLGPTTATQFATGLEDLLSDVCRPGRTVVMLELPLPPLRNAFGSIQRAAARRHGVCLVPKRFLLGLLTAPGATRDGVHLSPAGHQRTADRVWALLGSR